jgi:hypothetical protein
MDISSSDPKREAEAPQASSQMAFSPPVCNVTDDPLSHYVSDSG